MFTRAPRLGAAVQSLFTIAPDGSGLTRLDSNYLCCGRASFDGARIMWPSHQHGMAANIVDLNGQAASWVKQPAGQLRLTPRIWLPDGSIAYTGTNPDDPSQSGIYLGSPNSAAPPVQITRTTHSMYGADVPIAASPDGHQILFNRSHSMVRMDARLFVVKTDGMGLHQISPPGTLVTTLTLWGVEASWAPDSHQITFVGHRHGGQSSTVFICDADGTHLRQVAQNPGWVWTGAQWSPDGEWIMFDDHGVTLIHPDGTGQVTISDKAVYGTWSPDSHHIVFEQPPGADLHIMDLYVANTDGSNVTRLTNQPGQYYAVSWGQLPTR